VSQHWYSAIGGSRVDELTADGVFAFVCLLASILFSAVGDGKQAFFFLGCAFVFVAKDIATNGRVRTPAQ